MLSGHAPPVITGTGSLGQPLSGTSSLAFFPPITPLPDDPAFEWVKPSYNWRAGPTSIERRLYAALDSLGVAYEQQKWFGTYCVDAYLPTYRLALEADGCAWHCCPACEGNAPNPEGVSALAVRRKQVKRDARLRQNSSLVVVHIWGHDLTTDDAALAAVQAALAPYLNRPRAANE